MSGVASLFFRLLVGERTPHLFFLLLGPRFLSLPQNKKKIVRTGKERGKLLPGSPGRVVTVKRLDFGCFGLLRHSSLIVSGGFVGGFVESGVLGDSFAVVAFGISRFWKKS